MVYLITDGMTAGIAQSGGGGREIKSPYATLDEAQAQAAHDLTQGRLPLRIEDATGAVLWVPDA